MSCALARGGIGPYHWGRDAGDQRGGATTRGRRMRRLIGWIGGVMAVGVLAGSAGAGDPDPTRAGLSGANILDHIKVLASDEFEGRGPGTAGEEKAVAYLVDQFRKAGLKPGNPDGTFVQDVPLIGFQAKATSGAIRFAKSTIDLDSPEEWVAV